MTSAPRFSKLSIAILTIFSASSSGMMFIKLNVNHIVLFHFCNGVGGDQFGMETFGNIGKILENTLNIHNHGITCAGDDGQFLLQVGSCLGNAMTLKNFIGCTADAAQLNALWRLLSWRIQSFPVSVKPQRSFQKEPAHDHER